MAQDPKPLESSDSDPEPTIEGIEALGRLGRLIAEHITMELDDERSLARHFPDPEERAVMRNKFMVAKLRLAISKRKHRRRSSIVADDTRVWSDEEIDILLDLYPSIHRTKRENVRCEDCEGPAHFVAIMHEEDVYYCWSCLRPKLTPLV